MLYKAIIVTMLAILAACGFRPLYGTSGGDNPRLNLASVKIEEFGDRNGQIFANSLADLLNPSSTHVQYKYLFKYNVRVTSSGFDIRQDNSITRFRVTVNLTYELADIDSGEAILKSNLSREGGYDSVESDYATYVSQEYAIERALRELAQVMKVRIMSALSAEREIRVEEEQTSEVVEDIYENTKQ